MTIDEFLKQWRDDSDYVVAQTSGSTGEPKTIRLLKSDMRVSAAATNAFFGITEKSTLALPLSPDYIAGKMMAVRAEMAGCTLWVQEPSNKVVVDRPVDLLAVVPTQLDSLLANPDAPRLIGALLIGGAPMSDAQSNAVAAAGFNAWLGYGMTETCSHVALRRVGGEDLFRAMPGITFSTDDRDCLIVNSARYSWKTLATNDVVGLVSPTSFRWLGRADNVVNSGGVKLHPEVLEAEYRMLMPDLPDFFLTGEADERLGQRLVMVAVAPAPDLLKTIRAAIADHKRVPARIITVDELPRNKNGKLLRNLP